MATAIIAEGNFASATAGERLDIIGIEADYDGPSYVADNSSLLLSARQFDFSRLFDMIEEQDIDTPRLTDFIAKSVTELNDDQAIDGHSRRNGNMLRAGPPMRSLCAATCWETQAACADSGSNTPGRQANEPITEIVH